MIIWYIDYSNLIRKIWQSLYGFYQVGAFLCLFLFGVMLDFTNWDAMHSFLPEVIMTGRPSDFPTFGLSQTIWSVWTFSLNKFLKESFSSISSCVFFHTPSSIFLVDTNDHFDSKDKHLAPSKWFSFIYSILFWEKF